MKNNKLELLRGCASLMVFFCHSAINFGSLKNNHLYHYLVNWGTESVIIFFLLSGIVIHISQDKSPKTSGKFIKNRFKRIYPLYLIGLLLGLAFSGWNTSLFFGDLFFLGTLQGYIAGVPAFNNVLWSLSFEMFFYMVFAGYLFFGSKQKFLYGWLAVSVICIPLYYMQYPGLIGHLVAMLAFSSIWLLGYFLSANIARFPSVTRTQALCTVGLLIISSRIRYTAEYYCPVKFIVFSIVSIPIFIFCLQSAKQAAAKQNTPSFKWAYLAVAYVLLLGALRYFSDSLNSSKLIYAASPLVFLAIAPLLTSAVRATVLRAGAFLGFISYALYVVHYPLQHLAGLYIGNVNGIIVIFLITITILPLAWLLETGSQRLFVHPSLKRRNNTAPGNRDLNTSTSPLPPAGR